MSFSAYKRRVLVGWLRDIEDEGGPMPTSREVRRYLDFDSIALAQDIVDELVAEGIVAIDATGTPNARPRVLLPPGTPVTASASSIPPQLRQGAGVAAVIPESVERVPTKDKDPWRINERPSPPIRRGINRVSSSLPAVDGPPEPAAPAAITPRVAAAEPLEPAAPESPLARVGAAGDLSSRAPIAKADKPLIRADVIRAAKERGQPIGEFVTAMIDIGFAEWRKAQGQAA